MKKYIYEGGLGGRTDHLMTNITLLKKHKKIVFSNEYEEIMYINNITTLEGMKNLTISFLSLGDKVEGLTLTGF